jgi:hypothetical protein
MCANALADNFGRHRVRFANARRRLIELEYFKPVRQAEYRTAAMSDGAQGSEVSHGVSKIRHLYSTNSSP